jgi:ABC-type polar amino acid transport system ATPase subunit
VTPLLELTGVTRDYHGLRPLRVEQLALEAGDQVALLGFDRVTAELFINLVTGATLPDAGEIRVFGRATSSITDSSDWMSVVDRFGIISERAVLLDGLSVVQNLAIPFSLEVEPPSPAILEKARGLAAEVGIPTEWSDRLVGELDDTTRTRVRVGRALALNPSIVLTEHASDALPREKVAAMGRAILKIMTARNVAALALSADPEFARAVATRVLTLDAGTGRLRESSPGWLSRLAKMTRGG